MEEFENLLEPWRSALERFVYFKISIHADAEDVLQDIYITAYKNFHSLRDKSAFRSWLFVIAANKCKNYYASLAKRMDLSLDEIEENLLPSVPCMHFHENPLSERVHDTLAKLKDKDKQILYLYFFRELPQADIAKMLNVPIGTVKSRLNTAKTNFRNIYPLTSTITETKKESITMKTFPEYIPEYKIEKMELPPFEVRWEELLGWFIIPRIGEKISFAIYDRPCGKINWIHRQEVLGEAEVHGLRGVEICCDACQYTGQEERLSKETPERILVAQLTDTHCRFLASSTKSNGVKKYTTFLDGDEFFKDWGFGENNLGKEVNLAPKGDVVRNGNEIKFADKKFLLDVVGRYKVSINKKSYDTICVMDIEANVNGTVTEQFIDRNGRTVLWRIYCQDNMHFAHYNKLWTELLPDSDRLMVNGLTYVHWYDCITDYIL